MKDLQDPANNKLTDRAPNDPNGADTGSPRPARQTPWLEPTDGPLIANEARPLRVCPHCHIPVPLDSINCTRCGRFAPAHKDARKRLRKSDVEKLLQEVLADYSPQTTLQRHACQNLALTLAELKAVRPGTPEHQRLLQAVQTISATLDAARPASLPTDFATLSEDETLAKVLDIAYHLLDRREHRMPAPVPQPSEEAADEPHTISCGEPAAPPAPEPCEYCRRSPCLGPEHDAYEVLHFDDPREVQRRAEQAALRSRLGWDASALGDPITPGLSPANDDPTAVMMKQIGKPLPPWYRR